MSHKIAPLVSIYQGVSWLSHVVVYIAIQVSLIQYRLTSLALLKQKRQEPCLPYKASGRGLHQ